MNNSLHAQTMRGEHRVKVFLSVTAAAVSFATLLAGCGYSGPTASAPALVGSVHGGHQPVSGSSIQIYAAGSGTNGSAAQPLLSEPVKSDGNGNFSIPAAYGCPSASSLVYIVARGGSPGPSIGDNPQLALAAVLGTCGGLSTNPISVNEVTTVGSVWPLAAYMTDATHLGAAANDPSFVAAVASVPQFVNIAQGSSPGISTPDSHFAESNKLYSLADVLADCVNSSGGSAGDGTPCGRLFSTTMPSADGPPTDTVAAALRIARNPKNNVASIYGLVTANTAFQPTLTTAPVDWTLALSTTVATPSISLPTGTYTAAQEVALSDSTPGSSIYYTTDGTAPTSSSPAYSGPISVAVTTIVQAMAVLQGSQSPVAASTLTITSGDPAAKMVFLQQPSNTLAGATISPAVTVVIEDKAGNLLPAAADAVQLTLVGGANLTGTLVVTPQNGTATFSGLSVSTAGNGYTLLATSPNLPPAISAPFSIGVAGTGIPAQPVKLAFLQQPSNTLTQTAVSPAVTVVVEDGNGNTVPTATSPVTLMLPTGSGLSGTLTANPQNGIATFSNLVLSTAGSYTLSALSPGLASATSTSFSVSPLVGSAPPPPVKLAFVQQPSNELTGTTIAPPVTVVVQDSNGNTVPTATSPVTLALPGGTGLTGTLSATPQNGIATFSNLSVSTAGTFTLLATSPGLVPTVSAGFAISAPASGPPTVSCSANPTAVVLGGSTTITAVATSPEGRPLTYSWIASAGTISGTGNTVTLNTSGAAAGTITVTCTVADDQGRSASSTTSVSVNASGSGPLGITCSANPTTVTQGGTATITAALTSPQTLPLTYSYTASAGSISGTTTTATLNTSGAAAGIITVTCNVAAQGGGSASATTNVLVQSGTGEQALTNFQFTDSVAVNMHLGYIGTVYSTQFPTIMQSLVSLGVKHYRSGVVQGAAAVQYQNAETLGLAGIKSDWLMDINNPASTINSAYALAPDSVEMFEGPNEIDADVGSQVLAFTQLLYNTVRGNPGTASVPIIAPSFTSGTSFATQGNLSAYINFGNTHDYFATFNPETGPYGAAQYNCGGYGSMSTDLCLAKMVSSPFPVMSTETGYESGAGLSDAIIGRYLVRTLFEGLRLGIPRTYLYSLVDFGTDHYGLMTGNLGPKPAFTAIKSVMGVLQDVNFSQPGKLDYTLTGQTQNVHHLLLQKSDGTYYLAIWLAVQSANPQNPSQVNNIAPQPVTLNAITPLTAATTYVLDDTGSLSSSSTPVSNGSVSFSVTDRITLVALTPGQSN